MEQQPKSEFQVGNFTNINTDDTTEVWQHMQ